MNKIIALLILIIFVVGCSRRPKPVKRVVKTKAKVVKTVGGVVF